MEDAGASNEEAPPTNIQLLSIPVSIPHVGTVLSSLVDDSL